MNFNISHSTPIEFSTEDIVTFCDTADIQLYPHIRFLLKFLYGIKYDGQQRIFPSSEGLLTEFEFEDYLFKKGRCGLRDRSKVILNLDRTSGNTTLMLLDFLFNIAQEAFTKEDNGEMMMWSLWGERPMILIPGIMNFLDRHLKLEPLKNLIKTRGDCLFINHDNPKQTLPQTFVGPSFVLDMHHPKEVLENGYIKIQDGDKYLFKNSRKKTLYFLNPGQYGEYFSLESFTGIENCGYKDIVFIENPRKRCYPLFPVLSRVEALDYSFVDLTDLGYGVSDGQGL